MKIAYVTTYDVADINAFGGRGYYMAQALKDQTTELEYIGPLETKHTLLLKAKEYAYNNRMSHKRYTIERDRAVVKDYARQIAGKLASRQVDLVFSPMSPGSQPIAYLESDRPIVIWTDATFAGALDFYPHFRSDSLCKETLRDGLANERAALQRCSLAIYWSEWAARSAIEQHGVDPAKVKVVPVGPNLTGERSAAEVRALIDARPAQRCKLLFLGTDWYRKGGDVVFEVARQLNQAGLPTELSVVGCRPLVDEPLPDFVKPLGFISKSHPQGLQRINALLAESHFVIVPSRAEAFGMVFCEASAFGVPSLATNVGGIPTAVRDGVNGKTFANDAGAEAYCAYIVDLFAHYDRYQELARSAFEEYRTRLNWSVAGQTVRQLMRELVA